jgi:predicted DNA-binding transcriptional regulator AlpA
MGMDEEAAMRDERMTTECGCQLMAVGELAAMLGVHARTIWRLAGETEMGQGNFPRPLRIAPRIVRWRRSDVESYIARLAENGRR